MDEWPPLFFRFIICRPVLHPSPGTTPTVLSLMDMSWHGFLYVPAVKTQDARFIGQEKDKKDRSTGRCVCWRYAVILLHCSKEIHFLYYLWKPKADWVDELIKWRIMRNKTKDRLEIRYNTWPCFYIYKHVHSTADPVVNRKEFSVTSNR